MVKISSSGIEIVLTCIMHDYMSYWPTLGSYRHPWGLKSYFQNCSVPPFYWCQNLSREKCKPNGKRISLIRLMSEEKNPKQPLKNITFIEYGIFTLKPTPCPKNSPNALIEIWIPQTPQNIPLAKKDP